jgi:hypothetical protein
MPRPHTKIPEKPNKFCSICKREVYQTTHTAETYWADWYGTLDKVICVDCYKK